MKATTDLWFSAWLQHKGYKLTKYDIINRGRARYYFNLTEDEWKQEKLEFNNSDLSKFKIILESLKDLSY